MISVRGLLCAASFAHAACSTCDHGQDATKPSEAASSSASAAAPPVPSPSVGPTAVATVAKTAREKPDPVEHILGKLADDADSATYDAYVKQLEALRGKHGQALALQRLRPGAAMVEALRTNAFVRDAIPEGCQSILEAPDEMRLYSVDWNDDTGSHGLDALMKGAEPEGSSGSVALSPADVPLIVGYLYQSTALPDGRFGASCDIPHHAIVARKGAERVAIAMCFECSKLSVRGPRDSGGARTRWDYSEALRRLLHAKLKAGGIALNEPEKAQ